MNVIERFKAWRRGDKKVKGAERGRCFVREEGKGEVNDKIRIGAMPTLKVTAKVTRVDGSIEEYTTNG